MSCVGQPSSHPTKKGGGGGGGGGEWEGGRGGRGEWEGGVGGGSGRGKVGGGRGEWEGGADPRKLEQFCPVSENKEKKKRCPWNPIISAHAVCSVYVHGDSIHQTL